MLGALLSVVLTAQQPPADITARPASPPSPNGHAFVLVRGGEFIMGSPLTERGRSYSRTPDSPQVAVSWYDTAPYCNWLSEQAGLPREEWVYPTDIDTDRGLELSPNYLRRAGYRLPTEAEWEHAARAGTQTSRHFGDDEGRLSRYAWYDGNTKRERAYPVGQLLPNQWGLHDMLGNVWEWTFDRRQPYPMDGLVKEDVEDSVLRVSNDVARTRRGGSFSYEWFTVRSAHRGDVTYSRIRLGTVLDSVLPGRSRDVVRAIHIRLQPTAAGAIMSHRG
jgi:formylglycine-generating enzyme required for sulfatase activity